MGRSRSPGNHTRRLWDNIYHPGLLDEDLFRERRTDDERRERSQLQSTNHALNSFGPDYVMIHHVSCCQGWKVKVSKEMHFLARTKEIRTLITPLPADHKLRRAMRWDHQPLRRHEITSIRRVPRTVPELFRRPNGREDPDKGIVCKEFMSIVSNGELAPLRWLTHKDNCQTSCVSTRLISPTRSSRWIPAVIEAVPSILEVAVTSASPSICIYIHVVVRRLSQAAGGPSVKSSRTGAAFLHVHIKRLAVRLRREHVSMVGLYP